MSSCYHSSLEGAQHGGKSLAELLAYAKRSGASGLQPSNFHINDSGGFKTAAEIKAAFGEAELSLDGISAHCPFWVFLSAWTETPTIRPFIPENLHSESCVVIERWAEDYILRLLDLIAELDLKVVPMFWGLAFGLEVASGYPWGFWKGPGYDLIAEGEERFVDKTKGIREHAHKLNLKLCHEIHPGTAAATADDFLRLVEITDDDSTSGVNFDPSHCWEGEPWEARLQKVAKHVFAVHVKNHRVKAGHPLRSMVRDWPGRAMQFTDLATGDLNMRRYAEDLFGYGYAARYCQLHGTKTAPLVVEVESAFGGLDETSAKGLAYVRDELCFTPAEGSFEDGMGA